MSDIIYATEKTGMFVTFAGPSVPNPTEMLEKRYFRELIEFAKDQFDYVLIDCPPVGAAIDAAVIAEKCDGMVMVLGNSKVHYRQAQDVVDQIEKSGCKMLGVIRNNRKTNNRKYYYRKYYHADSSSKRRKK